MTILNLILSVTILIIVLLILRARRREQKLETALRDAGQNLQNEIQTGGAGQARLDAIVFSMSEGILVVDPKGEILVVNPSLRKTFLIDQPCDSKRPIEVIRNAAIQSLVDRILSTGEKLVTEELVLTAPEEKILKVNAVPIVRNDLTNGAVLVFHDVTQLRHLERIRQDFVANVSHELKTPICSIKGYVETLLDGAFEDSETLKKFLKTIYHDSDRLGKLIDDLLDLSKIESGKMKMVFLSVDLPSVVKRVVSVLEFQAKTKNLTVSIDIPESVPRVLADETRLTQVFLNLLDNALKYTPENGSVTISAVSKDRFVEVSVSDTGVGIPAEALPRIFERFYRVDKARSREMGGTGLGLSIVKHIIQAHNGEITVRSESEKGTTFSFLIPRG